MRKHLQLKAWLLLTVFVAEIFIPTTAMALGSGPSQPEMAAFTPAGTTEMVDPFTGDFSYNIPLMDVEGYPVNIAYNSGVTMEQEASWVGLGWNLNVGTMNRSVRGLPDDFKGEEVITNTSMKPMKIVKIGGGVAIEVFGVGNASKGFSLTHNNYKGFGIGFTGSVGASLGPISTGVGVDASSLDGTSVNASLGVSVSTKQSKFGSLGFGGSVGAGYNTRTGQSMLSFGTTAGYSSPRKVPNGTSKALRQQVGRVGSSVSASSSTSLLPVGMNSYTPFPSLKLESRTIDFSGSVGGAGMGFYGALNVNGSVTTQKLKNKTIATPAYGYVYMEESDNEVLKDFNRENQVILNKTVKNLSPTNYTYDVFSSSGQGISGMFRPFRNDIGILSDPEYSVRGGNDDSFGAEYGFGAYFHGGLSYNTLDLESSYGKWKEGNALKDYAFKKNRVGSVYEKVYFKSAGDLAETDESFFHSLGGFDAFAFKLNGEQLSANLINDKGGNLNSLIPKEQEKRDARSNVFSYLTAEDAENFSVEKLKSTSGPYFAGTGGYSESIISRVSSHRKPHHISEITQVNSEGKRYVFGVPAYNYKKNEVTYNTRDKNATLGENRVQHHPTDDSKDNVQGVDWYYSNTETPAYAHSFLLSSILSSDYQDRTGDGVSADDIGNAYKFDYTRTSSDYKWRTPIRGVSFIEGYKSDKLDQKASYSYGEKEQWYLNTIQSKTQVAEFYTSERMDALGVLGEQGGEDKSSVNAKSHRLDSILLFDKLDRLQNKLNAVPIKKIAFKYDYSLCVGVHNQMQSDSGKLTLRSIEVSYGRNEFGKQSPYIFNYSSTNPNYNSDNIDRWGNYKPSTSNKPGVSNSDFPYVLQDDSNSDLWSSAWSLTEILTPAGGKINVEYESDDYAFIQDKDAMQMFAVVGAGSHKNDVLNSSDNKLYNHRFLYIDRPSSVPLGLEAGVLKNLFLGEKGKLDNLYFKFLTSIGSGEDEYAPGYTSALDVGYCTDSRFLYVELPDIGPNPITKSAWGYFRQSLFEILYEQPNISDNGIESIIRGVYANINDIRQMFTGVERYLKSRNIANRFVKNQSFIRLLNPTKFKKGGGSRVKKIMMNDQWSNMSGEGENAIYGQEYFYTIEENGKVMSSGVASYEPMVGNDENPFRIPVNYLLKEKTGHIPAISGYQERPFGESFFPTATVGYSNVIIRNINHEVGKTSKAITQHRFYTAKDFPVFVDETTIQKNENPPKKTKFVIPVKRSKNRNFIAASQGYSIVLNDMHGKPQSVSNYLVDEVTKNNKTVFIKKLLGGTNYNYHFEKTPNGNQLRNDVLVLTSDGYEAKRQLGVEVDIAVENRRTYEENSTMASSFNLDVFPIPLLSFPLFVPTGSFVRATDIKESKYQVFTKVIQQYGLIKSIENFTDQYSQTTFNELYDGTTGQVLLTKTENEYKVDNYQFNLPAYIVNNQTLMGPGYETVGLELNIFNKPFDASCNTDYSAFTVADPSLINHGDEVIVTLNDGTKAKAWITLDDNNSYLEPVSKCDTQELPFYPKYSRLFSTFGRQSRSIYDSIVPYKKGSYKKEFGEILEKTKIYHLKEHFADIYSSNLQGLVRENLCEINYPNGYTTQYSDEINHIYHSSSCRYARNSFYIPFQIDSIGDSSIFRPSLNIDLSQKFEFSSISELGKFFDLNDTLESNLEALKVEVENDSVKMYWPWRNLANYQSDHIIKHFPTSDGYDVQYNSCLNIDSRNYLLVDPFNSNITARRIGITYNGWGSRISVGIGLKSELFDTSTHYTTPADSLMYQYTTRASYASHRINDKQSFEYYLSQPEQLYLIEYNVRNKFTGDTARHYYIENGRGYESLPAPRKVNTFCNAEDSLWDSRFNVTQYLADSLPCINNYRLENRSFRNGRYVDVRNVNKIRIVRPAKRNELIVHTAGMLANRNPMKLDGTNRFIGFKSFNDTLEIIEANAAVFSDQQSVKHHYNYNSIHQNSSFVTGKEGNFRSDSVFHFIASRSQKANIENSKDGFLEELPELWAELLCYDGLFPPNFSSGGQSSGWKFKESPVIFSTNGTPLESRNNLGIPSAQTLNYKGQVTANASNSELKDFAFDGFENYFLFGRDGGPNDLGFTFHNPGNATFSEDFMLSSELSYKYQEYLTNEIVDGVSHSGTKSLFVNRKSGSDQSNLNVDYWEKPTNYLEQFAIGELDQPILRKLTINETNAKASHLLAFKANLPLAVQTEIDDALNNSSESVDLVVPANSEIGHFNPKTGKYVISIWMKELVASGTAYVGVSPEVIVSQNGQTISFKAKGPIIDGWQKIEGEFNYDSNSSLTISLVGGEWGAFFDDFRIFPSESNMKSFVYDQYSNRLLATLDENNYAIYFDYDQAGIPTQVRKETSEGVLTISESRQSFSKR